MTWQVITGDCLEVMPTLDRGDIAAVVTDPPYGMKENTRRTRFTAGPNGHGFPSQRDWDSVINDDKPFDPTPFLSFPRVVLFGFNHFASRLPVGTTLVWIKRNEAAYGTFLSDAELAWMKGGHGVYCQKDTSIYSRPQNRVHPTQKPVELMKWVLDRAKVPPGALVLDPYCGSGTTGIACVQTGRRFIGIEIDEGYAEIARQRIGKAAEQAQQMELAIG